MLKKYWLLILILGLCVFFRAFRFEEFFGFGHDQDLLTWIAKDMAVDHHIRLIGQETSISGLFIGPLFYYLGAFFMFLAGMDPRALRLLTISLSVLTAFSFYFILSKFFDQRSGLIGAFLYSISLGSVFFDRWIVPTQPTLLWSIWYLYVLFSISLGDFKILPLLALLLGLIWYVHIAFVPLILLLPLAFFLNKKKNLSILKKIKFKDLILPVFILIILLAPFFVFEIRHGFGQTKALMGLSSEERGDLRGVLRMQSILNGVASDFSSALFYFPSGQRDLVQKYGVFLVCVLIFLFLKVKKVLKKEQVVLILGWVLVDILSLFISKRHINEYYYANLNIFPFIMLALFLGYFSQSFGKIVTLGLILFLGFNFYWLYSLPKSFDNYLDRKKLVEFIREDAEKNNYPCIAINYMSGKGANVGFRYLFWWSKVHLINPGIEVPVYSIAIPYPMASEAELADKEGVFGVILAKPKDFKDKEICLDKKNKLEDLSGFVN